MDTRSTMALADAGQAGGAISGGRLRAFVSAMQARLGAEVGARRAIRHLSQLDDHMLEDLGLVREQIVAVVRGEDRFAD